jgi:S-adenosyl-L-methionine hydrolase (adenosine-forming)
VNPPVVTLLTDYGPHSEHVGALHAVLVGADPRIVRVDLAHDIPRGDVRFGAVVLERLAGRLPAAVHLAVVDPGVGTLRRGLAVRLAGGGALVGPDNGLLGPAATALGAVAAVALPAHSGPAATFDGRDLFAPAAARLAVGDPLKDLGPHVDPAGIAALVAPDPEVAPGQVRAEVLGCDRFGNVQLAARPWVLDQAGFRLGARVQIAGPAGRRTATVGRTFGDVAPGSLVVYSDSHGRLALAEHGGDAASRLGVHAGDIITVAVTPVPAR